MKFIQTLKAAIARGKFEDPRIVPAINQFLKIHDADLDEVGYTISSEINAAAKEIDNILNDIDEETQRRAELVKEAAAEGRELSESE